jgi:hypothetical protein
MRTVDDQPTLSFDAFWSWLVQHPDCIVRAGTPECVIYDDEELHWTFTEEEPQTWVVQVLRGKLLVAELLVAPEQIAYVQGTTTERDDEFVFELVTETEVDRFPAYFFVLIHGFSQDEGDVGSRRVH